MNKEEFWAAVNAEDTPNLNNGERPSKAKKKVRFTQVPNDVLGKLIACDLPQQELRFVLLILRKTAGFHKAKDRISASQFAKEMKITTKGKNSNIEKQISKLANSLEDKKIIYIWRQKRGKRLLTNSYMINPRIYEWISQAQWRKHKAARKLIPSSNTVRENGTHPVTGDGILYRQEERIQKKYIQNDKNISQKIYSHGQEFAPGDSGNTETTESGDINTRSALPSRPLGAASTISPNYKNSNITGSELKKGDTIPSISRSTTELCVDNVKTTETPIPQKSEMDESDEHRAYMDVRRLIDLFEVLRDFKRYFSPVNEQSLLSELVIKEGIERVIKALECCAKANTVYYLQEHTLTDLLIDPKVDAVEYWTNRFPQKCKPAPF